MGFKPNESLNETCPIAAKLNVTELPYCPYHDTDLCYGYVNACFHADSDGSQCPLILATKTAP